MIRTLIRVGAAGCETLLFSLWGGKYVREKSHLYFQTHSVCFIQLFMNYFFADHKFASAGREDVDVRMLGSGMLALYVFSS